MVRLLLPCWVVPGVLVNDVGAVVVKVGWSRAPLSRGGHRCCVVHLLQEFVLI